MCLFSKKYFEIKYNTIVYHTSKFNKMLFQIYINIKNITFNINIISYLISI